MDAAKIGAAILESWRSKFHVREKARADLVTEADVASQLAIKNHLLGLFPGLSGQTGLLVVGVIGVVIGVMYLFVDFNAVQLEGPLNLRRRLACRCGPKGGRTRRSSRPIRAGIPPLVALRCARSVCIP